MNEYFAQTLGEVLEETSMNMGNAMVLSHLQKNGSVTLEEANFYHNLVTDVITEAAEDFIPDELDVPDAPVADAPIELYDAVGNKYVFQDGQLIPVDASEDELADDQMDVDADPDADPDAAAPVDESTEVVTESEEVPAVEGEEVPEVLEESDVIVARILANIKS